VWFSIDAASTNFYWGRTALFDAGGFGTVLLESSVCHANRVTSRNTLLNITWLFEINLLAPNAS